MKLRSAIVNLTVAGDAKVILHVPATLIEVYQIYLTSAGNVDVTIKDGSTSLTGPMSMVRGIPLDLKSVVKEQPVFSTAKDVNDFVISLSAAVHVGGVVHFVQQ